MSGMTSCDCDPQQYCYDCFTSKVAAFKRGEIPNAYARFDTMRCKQDMIDAGERLVPRTCPVHGINRCRPNPWAPVSAVRKGDWMITYTGGAFWPLDPRPEEIRIEDIAAALSKLCRFGGHSVRFYSVAEHLVHCASKAPKGFELAALLHDASEAYLSDVIRPIKAHLVNYLDIEANLERAIAERFELPFPMPHAVKALDEAIIQDEKAQACAPSPPMKWAQWDNNTPPLGVTLQFWTPAQAQYEFTTAFYRYGGKS